MPVAKWCQARFQRVSFIVSHLDRCDDVHMANQEDIDRWKHGKEHWNKWAAEQLETQRALEINGHWKIEASGKGANSETQKWLASASVDFSKTEFHEDVHFGGFHFPDEVIFSGSTFGKTASFVKSNFSGDAVFDDTKFDGEAEFKNAEFASDVSFRNCKFSMLSSFREATFNGNAYFQKVYMRGSCRFDSAKFTMSANFEQAVLSNGANFRNSVFVASANFLEVKFDKESDFRLARFHDGASFLDSNLRGVQMESCHLQNIDFEGANLEQALFGHADLRFANLQKIKVDSGTKFKNARVNGCQIDRYSLECLEDYGGLTVGDRMMMDIQDGFAILRSSYGGYLQWLHLAAFIGFAFPYVWFVAVQWGNATFNPVGSIDVIPLWQALAQFIYSGGEHWQYGFVLSLSFAFFLVALFYNTLRAILFSKD